jgi:hypothetical protein
MSRASKAKSHNFHPSVIIAVPLFALPFAMRGRIG